MAQWFQVLRDGFWRCLGRVDIQDEHHQPLITPPGSVALTSTSSSPSSPVLYLTKIDKEKFEWLRKESVEVDGLEIKSNNSRAQVSSIFTGTFTVHMLILAAAVVEKDIDVKHFIDPANVARVILLGVVAFIVINDAWTKRKTLSRLENQAAEIQGRKETFCHNANDFVSSTTGVEGNAQGATNWEIKDEIPRMQSMIELHSVPVTSYKWIYAANLLFSFLYFALWFFAWLVMIRLGKLHFPRGDVPVQPPTPTYT